MIINKNSNVMALLQNNKALISVIEQNKGGINSKVLSQYLNCLFSVSFEVLEVFTQPNEYGQLAKVKFNILELNKTLIYNVKETKLNIIKEATKNNLTLPMLVREYEKSAYLDFLDSLDCKALQSKFKQSQTNNNSAHQEQHLNPLNPQGQGLDDDLFGG